MSDITQLSDQQLKQALGYNSSSDITKLSDDELQKSLTPADTSSDMQNAQWGAQHPYLRALQDSANQSFGMFGKGLFNAVPGLSNNVPPSVNQSMASYNPQNINTNPISNTGAQIAGGLGSAIPTIALANPLSKAAGVLPLIGTSGKLGLAGITPSAIGMGGAQGIQAFGNNQPVGPAVGQGALGGAAFGLGGMIGSGAAQGILNPIAKATQSAALARLAPSIGSSLGMAGAGALTAPNGQKISNAITGGALGLLNPAGNNNYNDVLQDAADAHAKILGLGKGVIQKVEQKSGKDLNDSYQLAAQHGLTYDRGQEGKLDTTQAQKQIQPFMDTLHNQANAIVASDPNKQFDLQDLGEQAKQELRQDPKFKNDLAYNQAQDQIDAHVQAAIQNRGQFVDAPTLNNIKQGMWNASFEPLQPNNNAIARQLGNTAKGALEDAFPNSNLGDVNAQLGKYLDLKAVLSNANGNTIDRGKLGKYVAEGLGGVLGIGAGASVPVPFLHEAAMGAGALLGSKAGEAVNQMQTDPRRITQSLANKVKMSQFMNGINPNHIFSPVPQKSVMNVPVNSQPLIGNSTLALPSPRNVAYDPSQHTVMNSGAIKMGNIGNSDAMPMGKKMPIGLPSPKKVPYSPNLHVNIEKPSEENKTIIAGRPDLPYTPGPQSIIHPSPNAEDANFNPLKNPVSPQGLPQGVKALGMAAGIGLGSMFNPLNNAQAAQVKEPERLQLPGDQYTKKEEGFQANPYIDTTGNKTIGYGFNMKVVGNMLPSLVQEGKRPLTRPEADNIYNKLYSKAMSNAQDFAGDSWHSMNGQQQKALSDMSYNMGGKLNGFKKMQAAIQDGDFKTASSEIMNSNYAKEAKNRAMRNATLMMQ